MARQTALNEEALVKLGAEKLAGLVMEGAKRDAAFRKLVSAALASIKGPEAVAAIVDKRLAGLERAKGAIGWEKAKAFTADMAATLAIVVGDLAQADADAAIHRLLRFLSTADRVLQRIDDSSGRLDEVYRDAVLSVPGLIERLPAAERGSIPERLLPLALADDHGFLSEAIPEILSRLPKDAVAHLDQRLAEAARSPDFVMGDDKDWRKRVKTDRLIRFRQAIADCRNDVDAFIDLEKSRADGRCDTMAIAERLTGAGRHRDALEWARKRQSSAVKYLSYDDFADGASPRDLHEIARTRLEVRILEAMGERAAAQELRWKAFEATLDAAMLRDYVAHLGDFEEFDALDKAFAFVLGSAQKYRALSFFLEWPRLDLAAKLVIERRDGWEGRHYEILSAAAQTLEADHPLAATILYRALLDDILARARSPAYGHGARYLAKLDALAAQKDSSWPIDSPQSYRAALAKKHGRKAGFWSLVDKRS